MKIMPISNNYISGRKNQSFGVSKDYKQSLEALEKAHAKTENLDDFSLITFIAGYGFLLPSAISQKSNFNTSKIVGISFLTVSLASFIYETFLTNKYYKELKDKISQEQK